MSIEAYDNSWYKPGATWKRVCWMFVSFIFFQHPLAILNKVKIVLLKLFGAKVGKNVLFKPGVSIKYPWFLEIGNNVWIGEDVWIDNLGKVLIGNDVCISQGAYLLTGNHNYKSQKFDLIVSGIKICDGVWVGAKSIVCPGVTCFMNSILTAGSVITSDMDENFIYQGNPAKIIRERVNYDTQRQNNIK